MTQPRVRYKTHQPASAEIARLKNDPTFVTETYKLQFAESICSYLWERTPKKYQWRNYFHHNPDLPQDKGALRG